MLTYHILNESFTTQAQDLTTLNNLAFYKVFYSFQDEFQCYRQNYFLPFNAFSLDTSKIFGIWFELITPEAKLQQTSFKICNPLPHRPDTERGGF